MTDAQIELYEKTKNRLRRLGKENPAEVIVALAEEIEHYRAKIRGLEEELDRYKFLHKLMEQDVADWQKLAESKVKEIYPEFMRDYKLMEEELEGAYKEMAELTERLTPKKPTYVDTRFRNHGRHIGDGCSLDKCYKCPSCASHIFHVFDSEKYCNKCGQALDWGEEATDESKNT